jgi:hypothetical protein
VTPGGAAPPIFPEHGGGISPWATGVAGALGGLALGGAAMASRQLGNYEPSMEELEPSPLEGGAVKRKPVPHNVADPDGEA